MTATEQMSVSDLWRMFYGAGFNESNVDVTQRFYVWNSVRSVYDSFHNVEGWPQFKTTNEILKGWALAGLSISPTSSQAASLSVNDALIQWFRSVINGGAPPAGAILDEASQPILDEAGGFILEDP